MSFKSSRSRDVGKENIYYRSSNIGLGYGGGAGGGLFSAVGGTSVDPGNGYRYHVFTETGSTSIFTVASGEKVAEVFIVAGGGGGGNTDDGIGGGGGAGGIQYYTTYTLTPGQYAVDVGSGGVGAPAGSGQPTNGGNSSFETSTALGGGYGGRSLRPSSKQAGNPGGSGGGGCGFDSSQPGGTALQPAQPLISNAGGTNYGNNAHPGESGPGGGGGAGGASNPGGTPASRTQGGPSQSFPAFGNGNIGPTIPPAAATTIGVSGRYGAGGNGGGPGTSTPTPGGGGIGGSPGAGGDASGYGSGGGGAWGGSLAGGDGSPGIVIVRYQI